MTDKPVALVTGAAKRIGAAIAQALHASGYNIVIHYGTSEQDALSLAEKLNAQRPDSAVTVQGDLRNHNDIQHLAKAAQDAWQRLDVLVNNASSFYPTPVGEITLDDWASLVGSNVQGPLFLSQALAPSLKQSGGCIVNMVDMHIARPLMQHSVYCLAKNGLASVTKSLATELAPEIRVNGIGPGAILWPERELSDSDKQQMLQSIPLNRLGTPEDIAQTALFLINAPYITGQILFVDGGRSIYTHASA
ncbi:pteridine reductase [Alteromonas sp. H39]|uniref:pteridine reductase n=1 Tax=Alteromonas sp. H39 TaxID=3389876 RepID=UPI0039DF47DB